MTGFLKYPHLERLTSTEVEGLLDGICHVFYKIDGTNGSVWFHPDKGLQTGSRNRILSEDNDNAGFCNAMYNDLRWIDVFKDEDNRRLVFYGEWLVPHSLKTYRADAWRRFYVFDVWDTNIEDFLSYDDYKPLLDEYKLDYIPPLAIIKNPSNDNLYDLVEKSGQFLVEDNKGKGEGIVIKNYGFKNRFGRTTWGKIVTNEFKEANHKEMGAPLLNGTLTVEEQIVRDFLTDEFIQKEKSKIMLSHSVNGEPFWDSHMFPELLGRTWYEFIREETAEFLKAYKNPKIDFKFLQRLLIQRVKEVAL